MSGRSNSPRRRSKSPAKRSRSRSPVRRKAESCISVNDFTEEIRTDLQRLTPRGERALRRSERQEAQEAREAREKASPELIKAREKSLHDLIAKMNELENKEINKMSTGGGKRQHFLSRRIRRKGRKYMQRGGSGCEDLPWYYKYAIYSALFISGSYLTLGAANVAVRAASVALNFFITTMNFDVPVQQFITLISNLGKIIIPTIINALQVSAGLVLEITKEIGHALLTAIKTPQIMGFVAPAMIGRACKSVYKSSAVGRLSAYKGQSLASGSKMLADDITYLFNLITSAPRGAYAMGTKAFGTVKKFASRGFGYGTAIVKDLEPLFELFINSFTAVAGAICSFLQSIIRGVKWVYKSEGERHTANKALAATIVKPFADYLIQREKLRARVEEETTSAKLLKQSSIKITQDRIEAAINNVTAVIDAAATIPPIPEQQSEPQMLDVVEQQSALLMNPAIADMPFAAPALAAMEASAAAMDTQGEGATGRAPGGGRRIRRKTHYGTHAKR